MSVDQAKAFLEKMKTDEPFRARVMAEEDVAARMALIAAEGFDCSAEEIGALQELGEAELSGAVGRGGVEDRPGTCWVLPFCDDDFCVSFHATLAHRTP